jgi:hypothetical protein
MAGSEQAGGIPPPFYRGPQPSVELKAASVPYLNVLAVRLAKPAVPNGREWEGTTTTATVVRTLLDKDGWVPPLSPEYVLLLSRHSEC